LLRDCAASALSSDAPEYILAASRILGHRDLTTTLGHYEQSSMLSACANLAATLKELQEQALKKVHDVDDVSALPFLEPETILR